MHVYDGIMLKGLCGIEGYELLLTMWVLGLGTLLMVIHMFIDPMLVLSFVDYDNAKFEIGNEMRFLDDKSLASSPNWIKTGPRGPTLASYLPPKLPSIYYL